MRKLQSPLLQLFCALELSAYFPVRELFCMNVQVKLAFFKLFPLHPGDDYAAGQDICGYIYNWGAFSLAFAGA
jgi:hypothetical protein